MRNPMRFSSMEWEHCHAFPFRCLSAACRIAAPVYRSLHKPRPFEESSRDLSCIAPPSSLELCRRWHPSC
ncbi:unnamed protein product [Vitrella brassicaformis CCMP3155]|uniref:Uncharacterized protein n=1 Tax=Vitrella brassicaformis (strain CCMP3155) TaxID=1169540 RepID=A0A0G4EKE5_VITBC|nr:unnamed protein product [Vitrella brassicaformis CCMP3155]|eukprot:CEL97003.1 unnamed protein product [Vitrella brassicaformis CCMP3155]